MIYSVQVIVATHSVFALHMKDANFIDTTPDYSTKRFELMQRILEDRESK